MTLRRRRQRVAVTQNWEYFYYQFYADHARADLIWNYKTREELREALEGEVRAFLADKDLRGKVGRLEREREEGKSGDPARPTPGPLTSPNGPFSLFLLTLCLALAAHHLVEPRRV